MKLPVDEKLYGLAQKTPAALYVVGGFVRNFLISGKAYGDLDIAAAIPAEEFLSCAENAGFEIAAFYPRTGTVVIKNGDIKCEYTAFRKELYMAGGGHTPALTIPIKDIKEDALRRDFKCNALYYDVKNEEVIDPLGGLTDIKNKTLSAVKVAEEVFKSDGLRLMRLARFAGELGFSPDKEAIAAANKYSCNIADISPERIYDELKKMLVADEKYEFSDKKGHYTSLKILDETHVLDGIIPELTSGRGMPQRADFHKYDVLEHSLRTVLYAERDVRLAALFHDVAKPYCKNNFGEYHGHAGVGEKMTERILKWLKADNKTIKETAFLVGAHMKDLQCDMKEARVRRFIAENNVYIEKLLLLKQADYSAGKDDFSISPTVKKWRAIYEKMLSDGTPFSVKELGVSAEELIEAGYCGKSLGRELKRLLNYARENPSRNDRETLLRLAEKDGLSRAEKREKGKKLR